MPREAPEISIVIPVYQAEGCLTELTRRLKDSLETITDNYEIIYIEDHGKDRSWQLITEFAAQDKRIKGFKFCRNFGQPYALSAGIDMASGNWIVIMDCDLQDQPEEIPKLYAKSQEGYDLVLARRIDRRSSFFDRLTSRCFSKIFDYFTGIKSDYHIGAFRILSHKVADTFRGMSERQRFFGGMIQWMGYRAAMVDVEHAPRYHGKSSYDFFHRFSIAAEAIVSFSNKPLLLSIRIGGLVMITSLIYAASLVYRKFFHDIPVEGYTSIMVSLFFLSSLIIINLGIVGLYIGRIFDQTKGRPLYIIESKTTNE
jgi:dolichol-phosphate mannosyltransferase